MDKQEFNRLKRQEYVKTVKCFLYSLLYIILMWLWAEFILWWFANMTKKVAQQKELLLFKHLRSQKFLLKGLLMKARE
jgi:hypothetical protein